VIEKASIEKIRAAVAASSDESLEEAFDRFFSDQAELCSFLMDVTSASRQRVRELTLYLSYVVYRTVTDASGHAPGPVTPERITAASLASQEWIQKISELDDSGFQAATATRIGVEPYLLGYVVTEVQDAIDDGLELRDEEKGTVFFVMKTVIALMSAEPGDL
jgi:hypothetical protein